MEFYSYLWLRSKAGFAPAGTPYYAGKGSGNRACSTNHNVHPPKDRSLIVIFPMLNEAEAFESEMALIELFGRQDNGTGILRNRTDGGEGPSGYKFTEDQLRKQVEKNRKLATDSKWQQTMAEMRASDEYQKAHAEGVARRDADPEYQQAHAEGIARRDANPEYQQAHAEGVARRDADPEYQQAHAEGIARRDADPEYQQAMAEMYASDEWQQAHAEGIARYTADPEGQKANAEAGRKTNHNRWHVKGWFNKKTGKHFPPKPSVRCPLCSEQGLVAAWG